MQKALDASQRALALVPDDPDLIFGLALVLQVAGKLDEALVAYGKVLSLQPAHRATLLNMPMLLAGQGRLDRAIGVLRQGLAFLPADADLHFNLGNLLLAEGEYESAAAAYRAALAVDPGMVRARIAAALTDAAQGGIESATAELDEIARRQPAELAGFLSPLREDRGCPVMQRGISGFSVLAGHECLRHADWRYRDALTRNFRKFIESDEPRYEVDAPEYLFLSYALEMPSAARARLAARIAGRLARQVAGKPVLPRMRPAAPDRIRLAYLAADFRNHPLFDILMPILKLHDRQRFEILLFSTGPDDGSVERERLVGQADRFIDLSQLDDDAKAGRIVAEAPDIIVDLSGYTLHAAPVVLARRLAPVQFSYAGFLCSQGAPWIDYAVLDRYWLPESERQWWTERIVHAPLFPLVRPARAVDLRTATPLPSGVRPSELPAGQAFVFCAFHSTWKVNPPSFALWMQLLQRSEDSVLWLLAEDERVRRNYRNAAHEHGVDPARLCFAAPLAHREHLLRLRHADLFLDTLGCGAHTTAAEALVLGLPVVTRAGVAVHERYAAALLIDAGLSDLVAGTVEDYLDIASRLASDTRYHQACRHRVAQAFSPAAIEEHDLRCVEMLESAYATALNRHQRGEAPADLVLLTSS
ncbi:MAG: tetratricopeptide repeat protein [Dechloromonas sp.]|nr:tetratricopeptide repeat protein [Dechloromonas sp.]